MAGTTRTPAAEDPAAQRAADTSCWMCGIRLDPDQMVPDGTRACDDIRWYCQDTWACTQRWTSGPSQAPAPRSVLPESDTAAAVTRAARPAAPDS